MAYEMNPDTFNFQFNPDNIGAKYPALKCSMKIGNEQHDLAAWVRQNKYGVTLSGNTPDLQKFLRLLFGSKSQPSQKPADISHMREVKEEDEDSSSLIR